MDRTPESFLQPATVEPNAADVVVPSAADVLRRAKALIDAPEKWSQHVGMEHSATGRMLCSLGALGYTMGGGDHYATTLGSAEHGYLALAAAPHSIVSLNRLGHAETMQMFDRAITLATAAARGGERG